MVVEDPRYNSSNILCSRLLRYPADTTSSTTARHWHTTRPTRSAKATCIRRKCRCPRSAPLSSTVLTSEISISWRSRPILNSNIKIQIRCIRARMDLPRTIRTVARRSWCNRAIMSVDQISSACPTTTTTGLASRSSRTSYATASTSSSRCCNRSRYPFPHRQVSCISREVRGIQPLAKARITSNRSTLPVEASRFLRTRWPSLRIKVSRIKTLRWSLTLFIRSSPNLSAQRPNRTKWSIVWSIINSKNSSLEKAQA